MSDAATQTGVETEIKTVGNTQRNDRLAEIVAASREERDKELTDGGFEIVDTLNVEESEEVPEEPEEPEEPETPEEPEPEKEEPPAERLIKVKVDGKEMEVPESQIIDAGVRTVQKEAAADQRLAEATRLLKAAQEAATPKKAPLPEMDEVELANRIRMGSDDEAQEAIRILQGREKATPEEIAAAVEGRVLAKIEFQNAVDWFRGEYKEIVSDPYLLNLAIAEEARLRENGDTRSYKDVYKEVGDGVMKKLTEWRGGKAAVSTSESKQERKATITNLPFASARQKAPEQPKPKTTAEIIEEMRQKRGQR
jgi:hypothetical protein